MPSDSPATEKALTRTAPVQMQEEEIEALRQQCRALLETTGMSAAKLAQELNVKAVTFNSWLARRYAGRNDLQAVLVRSGLQQRADREAVRAVAPAAPAFTLTPSSREFLEIFAHAQHLPDFAVITGAAGIGKTSAACHYSRTTPAVWKIVCSPSVIGPRALLDEFARTMGVVERLALHNLHHTLVQRLRGTNGLLIVDEAQHLQPQALDELRGLHDQAGIGVVLLGNEVVLGRINGGVNGAKRAEFAQLSSRIGRKLTRKGTRAGDAAALLSASEVDDEEVRDLLIAVSRRPGALRGMSKTLRLALLIAARDQVPLAPKHVELADRSLRDEGAV